MRKLMSKSNPEDFLLSLPIIACKEEDIKLSQFEFINCITQVKRPLKIKQNELLQDTLGLMAPELGAVNDNFQEVKDSTACTQMQSSQIVMFRFSSRINLSDPKMPHSSRLFVVYLVM